MAIEKTINIKVNSEQAKKELTNIKKGTDDIGISTSDLTSKIDSMTGGAITKFKTFTTGLNGIAVGFKGIGTAIALSGLGLLIITISAITAAFKNSEEGQNKFAKIMGVIGSVTGNLIDTLAALGEKIIWVFENPKQSLVSFGNAIKQNIINRFTGMLELFPAIGKAMKLVFEGEFAKAGEVAVNAIGKVTTGIENTTGKLKGLAKGTKEYAQEIAREAKLASKIADDRAKADKIDRDLTVQRAEADRKRADLLEKAANKDKYNSQQRIAFLKEAGKVDEDITNKEIASAKLRANAKVLENSLSGSNKEALNEEAELKAKVIQLETARLTKQKEVTGQIIGANAEITASNKAPFDARKALTDEANKLEAEAEKKRQEEKLAKEMQSAQNAFNIVDELNKSRETPAEKEQREYEEKLSVLEENNLSTELLTQIHLENLAKINKDASDKRNEENKKASEENQKFYDELERQEENLKNAKIGAVSFTADLIKNLAGKNKAVAIAMLAVEKGLAIAQIVSSAGKSIAQAQANLAATPAVLGAIPNPMYPVQAVATAKGILSTKISAATSIASILAQTITSAKGLSSGGDASQSQGGTPTQSAPSFNLVQGTSSNQIAQSLAQSNAPIKAYVVSTDMTTNQSLDRNILNNSRIG